MPENTGHQSCVTNFGPRVNYTTSLPDLPEDLVAQQDTWFKDSSGAGACDGTPISAAWLNMVTAFVRSVHQVSGRCPTSRVDLDFGGDAISAIIGTRLDEFLASSALNDMVQAAIEAAINGGVIQTAIDTAIADLLASAEFSDAINQAIQDYLSANPGALGDSAIMSNTTDN